MICFPILGSIFNALYNQQLKYIYVAKYPNRINEFDLPELIFWNIKGLGKRVAKL